MEQIIDVPIDAIAGLAKSFKAITQKANEKISENRADTRPMIKTKKVLEEKREPPKTKTQGFLDIDIKGYSSPIANDMTDRVPDSMYNQKPYKASSTIPTITEAMVMKSKLPDSIKQATLKYKDTLQEIKQPLPDVSKTRMDLMGGGNKAQITEQYDSEVYTRTPRTESSTNNLINEDYIRELVRSEMLKMMGEEYIKKVKEDTMRSTIKTLKNKGLLKQ